MTIADRVFPGLAEGRGISYDKGSHVLSGGVSGMPTAVLRGCDAATMDEGDTPYGLVQDCAIGICDGLIGWVGPRSELPAEYSAAPDIDLDGSLVTPGLIDCHTHIVFAGSRAREFEMRLGGVSYADIARQGGGILSTMRATRSATGDELVELALPRLDSLIAEGVVALEIKSGYGLSIEDELKMLRAARALGHRRDQVRIVTSWLAAHAVPPEFRNRPDAYIDEVAIPGLVQAHEQGLVDFVDGFLEGIAFDAAQISRLFDVAASLDLPVRLHCEQLSNLGGAALAAGHGALSADHLEYLDRDGIAAMARADTVAVLLPGAFYTLGEKTRPPVEALRGASVPIAVATDGNPGSSPLFSVLLAMNMSCILFGLTPEEALAGVTRNAARALALDGSLGTISPGKRADLAVWNVGHPAELAANIGINPIRMRLNGGVPC